MRSNICLFIFLLYTSCLGQTEKKKLYSLDLELVKDKDERFLLYSTLDGVLTAIDQHTGKTKWKIKEKPIVQVPLNVSNTIVPIYLPDPRDGSLYLIGDVREPLKKLPFSIPQLVSTSPCRSSDGILYTGKKKDTWFKLDPTTGRKHQILGWDDYSPTCPVDIESSIYIGSTQYTLRMVDEKKPENKWNVTFYDYTARSMVPSELNSYDLVHITSTSSGQILTLNKHTGNLLWETDLENPVIGIYLLDPEGLISLPFTSLENQTMMQLKTDFEENGGILHNTNLVRLYPTLYIGEHQYGLFALPSLVDKNYVTVIGSDNGPLLLAGPHASDNVFHREYPLPGYNYYLPNDVDGSGQVLFQSLPNFGNHIVIYTGHYNVPSYSVQKLLSASKDLIIFKKDSDTVPDSISAIDNNNMKKINDKDQINFINIDKPKDEIKNDYKHWCTVQYQGLKMWINQQENKGLKISLIIMTGCVIAMFWYLQIQVREFQSQSRNSSQSSQHNFNQSNNITALPEELPNGLVKIGKITFHPDQLLGKGCDGTFVYRGEFDSRRVAVKRLLPECFTFADREVALLRESDAHPNVIRYYCMEQDRMFRYIALELCQATLSEYIQGTCDICPITPLDILKQATAGLCHLHSLDIVHRDIKPHNVLISVPDNKGEVRVMISDFGLCKKLQVGKMSFSRRSGVTGTDGWIAPEMLNSTERTTYAVDMFSLGCLYYYVLSNGLHPFGDSLRRQANILSANYDLSGLKGPDWIVNIQNSLIAVLISEVPEERPPCKANLDHPMFWSHDKILNFFQEVSDRVEQSSLDDPILQRLEEDGRNIVKEDWRAHIHEVVASDLRKYRSYHGESVRDLLRALRNKKHHFRELSVEAQAVLGKDSESFTVYWLSRFPLLLFHTWITMQNVADEEHFRKFYHTRYRYCTRIFKEQMLEYIAKHPPTIPEEYFLNLEKSRTDDLIKKSKYNNLSPVKKLEPKVSAELVKSGGLYRNHDEEKSNKISNMYYQKKKKTKKSDEPLVWAVGN